MLLIISSDNGDSIPLANLFALGLQRIALEHDDENAFGLHFTCLRVFQSLLDVDRAHENIATTNPPKHLLECHELLAQYCSGDETIKLDLMSL